MEGVTVIGLRSGKEFVVQNGAYPFTDKVTGEITVLFFSADGKRVITVPPKSSPVEFYDEPNTEDFTKSIKNAVPTQDKPEVIIDPNVG